MTRGTLWVIVNRRVLEPNSMLQRDVAGPTPSSFLFLDIVDFGWTSVTDVGQTLGEQTQGASFSFSHTFGWEMCVGNVTGVSNSNLIHCGCFATKEHWPEL